MPTATSTITTSRRSALGLSAAAIVAGIAAPRVARAVVPDPDAELIAVCAEAERLEDLVREIDRAVDSETPDEETARACDAWEKAREQVGDLPATTLAGIRAKSRVVRRALIREYFWSDGGDYRDPDEVEPSDVRSDAAVALSLCDDLMRLGGMA